MDTKAKKSKGGKSPQKVRPKSPPKSPRGGLSKNITLKDDYLQDVTAIQRFYTGASDSAGPPPLYIPPPQEKLIPGIIVPDTLHNAVKNITPTQLQLFYEITIKGLQQLPFTPSARQCLEVICLRQIAFTLDKSNIQPLPEHTSDPVKTQKTAESAPQIQEKSTATGLSLSTENWSQVTAKLSCSGMTLALLQNTEFSHIDENNVIHLTIEKNKAAMLNDTHKKRIEAALSNLYNKTIKTHIAVRETTNNTPIQQEQARKQKKHDDTKSSLLSDDNIQTIMHQFDAKIDTVTPRS